MVWVNFRMSRSRVEGLVHRSQLQVMAEHSGVLFGTFTPSEVLDLYRTESTDLEFRWQVKESNSFQSSLLKSLKKMTSPNYNQGGSISPNIPRNPPTTPVSEFTSRGVSPNPLQSRLNANAPPFVPGTTADDSNSGNENNDSMDPEPGQQHRPALNDVGTEPVAMGDRLAPPTVQMSCISSSTPVESEGSAVPIQTVGVPTPSLPSMTGARSTESDTVCRQVQPAASPSVCSSTSDAARSPNSTPLHSPPGTRHQLSQSPSHSHSTVITVSPETTEGDPANNTPTPTHKAHNPQGAHHSSTVTNVTPHKPKTWASIVGKSGSGSSQVASPTNAVSVEEGREGRNEEATEGGDGGEEGEKGEGETSSVNSAQPAPSTHLKSLGDQLRQMCVSHNSMSLQPRGLINQGNWCYMHAPLQALISVPEICHLLRCLNPDPPLSLTPSDTPLTDALTQFIREFVEYQPTPAKPGVKKKRAVSDVVCGAPFRPDCIYDLLHKIRTSLSTKGKQEDAEEFLCCVLGGLHEEMVAAQTAMGQEGVRGEGEREAEEKEVEAGTEGTEEEGGGAREEGEWEQVGPKNKSTITRQTSFNESPVSDVFGGELRAVLQRQGAKESATVEPFFSLQLDIQSKDVWTVQDALEGLATREAVQMNSGTQNEVDAHRRQSLARLPVVLVLHLKRFLFDKMGGSQKLMKHVPYKLDLEVGRDLLAPAIRNRLTTAQKTYKLWAVVYHHGKSAVGGHYTCDVRHIGSGGWLRIDDSIVKPIPEEAILWQPQGSSKVAYLLFYRRSDYVRTT